MTWSRHLPRPGSVRGPSGALAVAGRGPGSSAAAVRGPGSRAAAVRGSAAALAVAVRGPGSRAAAVRGSAGALAAWLVLTGCGGAAEVTNAATAAAVSAPPVEVADDAAEGVLGSEEAVVGAPQLRLMLEQVLGEHVLLIAGAATDHAQGQTTEESLAVVADNTDALTDAITLVYGEVGGRAFASLWSQHVAFFLDHARGTANGDHQAIDEATRHLQHYEQGLGSFTETATDGALPAEAVAQLLGVHVADVNGYVDARLSGEAELAATRLAFGHDHAAEIGATLAAAIAGQGSTAFPGETADERTEVAAELARALSNHLAVRTSLDGTGTDAAIVPPSAEPAPTDPAHPIRSSESIGSAGNGEPAVEAGGTEATGPAGSGEPAVDTGGTEATGPAGSGEPAVDAATAAAARLDAAVRAAAADPATASAHLQLLITAPVGTRTDADALAAALGVPDLGEILAAIATSPTGDPTDPAVIDAQRAAYRLATAWLG